MKKKEKKEKKQKEFKDNKFIRLITNKWLQDFTITLLLIAIIICIFVILNTWIDSLDITDIDLTTDRLYSLSQESKDKVSGVSQETKILFFGMSDYTTTIDLAKQYNKVNDKISVEEISDVSSRPDLVQEYGLENDSTAIIVESAEKKKILLPSDLTTYDYSTYESIDTSEEALTNAIMDVNLEKKPKIYIVTNHTHYSNYLYMATTYLENEANEVENLDLLVQGSVPEDCTVLVLTTLYEDITEAEKSMIMDYINKGGKILVLQDPDYNNSVPTLTNYQSILDLYGVSVADGVVFESDSQRMISGNPNMLVPELSYSSEVTQYIASDGTVLFFNTGKLNFKSSEELDTLGVEVEDLATFSDEAFLRTDLSISTSNKTDADASVGGEKAGALITKKINDDTESQMIIFANSMFALDIPVDITSNYSQYAIAFYNNRDLVMNSIGYLTQRTDTITIRKDVGSVTYTATESENRVIIAIIIALPILIILIGIIVWRFRMRKK